MHHLCGFKWRPHVFAADVWFDLPVVKYFGQRLTSLRCGGQRSIFFHVDSLITAPVRPFINNLLFRAHWWRMKQSVDSIAWSWVKWDLIIYIFISWVKWVVILYRYSFLPMLPSQKSWAPGTNWILSNFLKHNYSFCLIIPDYHQSPASSPVQHCDNKLMSPTRTITTEQKPFRGFDITSLIRKDDDDVKQDKKTTPPPSPNNNSSPTLSRGPPIEKSSNPYAGLFGSNLYQQYLGHILSSQSQGMVPPGSGGPPPPFPPFNPMLLQAQLAMAAQNNSLLNNYNGVAQSMLAERLKQQRFAPYSRVSPSSLSSSLNTSLASSMHSPNSSGPSAFRSLTPKSTGASSPPVSPPSCASPGSLDMSTSPKVPSPPAIKLEPKNDIKNIESMIHGLNGSADNRYSLSHDVK